MAGKKSSFEIDDDKTFEDNLQAFIAELAAFDPVLARILEAGLPQLLSGSSTKADIWDALLSASAENHA